MKVIFKDLKHGEIKLMPENMDDIWHLYNLVDDPLEMNNLADNPQYAAKVKELREKLHSIQQEISDPIISS